MNSEQQRGSVAIQQHNSGGGLQPILVTSSHTPSLPIRLPHTPDQGVGSGKHGSLSTSLTFSYPGEIPLFQPRSQSSTQPPHLARASSTNTSTSSYIPIIMKKCAGFLQLKRPVTLQPPFPTLGRRVCCRATRPAVARTAPLHCPWPQPAPPQASCTCHR